MEGELRSKKSPSKEGGQDQESAERGGLARDAGGILFFFLQTVLKESLPSTTTLEVRIEGNAPDLLLGGRGAKTYSEIFVWRIRVETWEFSLDKKLKGEINRAKGWGVKSKKGRRKKMRLGGGRFALGGRGKRAEGNGATDLREKRRNGQKKGQILLLTKGGARLGKLRDGKPAGEGGERCIMIVPGRGGGNWCRGLVEVYKTEKGVNLQKKKRTDKNSGHEILRETAWGVF